jgi:hypothetical protein
MFDLELDVDELRCQLVEARAEALGLADELAEAVEQGRHADAVRVAANYRQTRTQIRRLVTALRVEECLI